MWKFASFASSNKTEILITSSTVIWRRRGKYKSGVAADARMLRDAGAERLVERVQVVEQVRQVLQVNKIYLTSFSTCH